MLRNLKFDSVMQLTGTEDFAVASLLEWLVAMQQRRQVEAAAHPRRAWDATKTRTSANGRDAAPVWQWR